MSCCGNKRKDWLNEVRSSTPHNSAKNISPVLMIDKPERTFEYLGSSFLMIKGAASGRSYHFSVKGDRVNVEYADSLAMMAERELKILPLQTGNE